MHPVRNQINGRSALFYACYIAELLREPLNTFTERKLEPPTSTRGNVLRNGGHTDDDVIVNYTIPEEPSIGPQTLHITVVVRWRTFRDCEEGFGHVLKVIEETVRTETEKVTHERTKELVEAGLVEIVFDGIIRRF